MLLLLPLLFWMTSDWPCTVGHSASTCLWLLLTPLLLQLLLLLLPLLLLLQAKLLLRLLRRLAVLLAPMLRLLRRLAVLLAPVRSLSLRLLRRFAGCAAEATASASTACGSGTILKLGPQSWLPKSWSLAVL